MHIASHSDLGSDCTFPAETPPSAPSEPKSRFSLPSNSNDLGAGVWSTIKHCYLQDTSLAILPDIITSDAFSDSFKGSFVQFDEAGCRRESDVAITRLRVTLEECHHVRECFI
jgi:hypothetical protein